VTTLLTALAITLGIAVVGLFIAWGRAERRAARAEAARDRAEKRLTEQRQADARMARHFDTVPRERPAELPTLQFPTFTRPAADTPTRHLHSVHPAPYRYPRKDHNQR
jgi:hypothetical protein